MANWHALTGLPDGNSFRIVFHIAIPSTNNRVNVNYRTALINSGLGGKTVLPDGDGTGGTISAVEKTSIENGSLYEYEENIDTNPTETAAQLQARITNRYTTLIAIVQDRLQKRLTYFGHTQ